MTFEKAICLLKISPKSVIIRPTKLFREFVIKGIPNNEGEIEIKAICTKFCLRKNARPGFLAHDWYTIRILDVLADDWIFIEDPEMQGML